MATKKKYLLMFAMSVILTCFVLVLKVLLNLFILISTKGENYSFCSVNSNKNYNDSNDLSFPYHIHQIFFYETDEKIPIDLALARHSWVDKNPNFKYTLWNSTMALDLIKFKFPELLPLYNSYSHWVRRADVARYVILYEYGGVYVDMDIGCRGRIDVLINSLATSHVVLYLTKPFGVSNDFMIAKPRTAFFRHVLCGLGTGNRWYILPSATTIMMTGPGYLYSRYKTFDRFEDVLLLRESALKHHIKHQDGGAWHGLDAKIIWWIFINWKKYITHFLFVVCFVITCICILLGSRCRQRFFKCNYLL